MSIKYSIALNMEREKKQIFQSDLKNRHQKNNFWKLIIFKHSIPVMEVQQ